jgi:hypothetical protein
LHRSTRSTQPSCVTSMRSGRARISGSKIESPARELGDDAMDLLLDHHVAPGGRSRWSARPAGLLGSHCAGARPPRDRNRTRRDALASVSPRKECEE